MFTKPLPFHFIPYTKQECHLIFEVDIIVLGNLIADGRDVFTYKWSLLTEHSISLSDIAGGSIMCG